MSQTRLGNQIRQTYLNETEMEVIIACLIGDGTLSRSGRNYRLRVEHSFKDKEYVEWKYELLRHLCLTEIQYVPSHHSLRFGTVGHPQITKLRGIWYRPKKQIHGCLVLTPLTLSIWFMDDGTKHRDTVDFSVHSFSEGSLRILRSQLYKRYGIVTTVNLDSKGRRLYVRKKSYPIFKELTKPYILKCMARKLP
jgi:hypothetical protein